MDLKKLSILAEKLRKKTIGDPIWIDDEEAFKYPDQTIELVVILKLFRAIQGVKSQLVLCNEGLFIDMSALYRCVNDCHEEITFLLERYPEQSGHVKQFIKHFYGNQDTPSVQKKKIRSAHVRLLTGQDNDNGTTEMSKKVHTTFCGYIHANYLNIMQSYGGTLPNMSFNLLGVPSGTEKEWQMRLAEESYKSIIYSMWLICTRFNQNNIALEAKNLLD